MIELPTAAELPTHHVIVRFGSGIDIDFQGRALLAFEKWMRERGVKAEVFKESTPDDSKLRLAMTPEKRMTL